MSYFEKEKETTKADELYEIGKFLFEHGTHNVVGIECILESSKKGFTIAKEKLAEIERHKLSNYFELRELYHYFGSSEMQKTLKDSWDNKKISQRFFHTNIVHFSNQCVKLYKDGRVNQRCIDIEFGTLLYETDLFYQEKSFLLAVFCDYKSTYERRLRKLSDEYPPVKEMLTGVHPYSYEVISRKPDEYLKWFITEYLTTRVSK